MSTEHDTDRPAMLPGDEFAPATRAAILPPPPSSPAAEPEERDTLVDQESPW